MQIKKPSRLDQSFVLFKDLKRIYQDVTWDAAFQLRGENGLTGLVFFRTEEVEGNLNREAGRNHFTTTKVSKGFGKGDEV